MLTIIDQQVNSAESCSIRWQCTTLGITYFEVYRGLSPSDEELLTRTADVAVGNISLISPKDDGEIYITIHALNSNKEIKDSLKFRITHEDIATYLKYRKRFEDNFLRAALQSAAGTQIAILQRKLTGPKCTRCIDSVTGESGDPRCPLCYGTGYLGGFYTPIIAPGLRGAKRVQEVSTGNYTPSRQTQASLILPAYPRLYKKDYLVDLADFHMYEVIDQGYQVMEYDHQRLGSTMYQVNKLPRDHPITAYDIQKELTEVTSVNLSESGEIGIVGQKLNPMFGRLSLTVINTEHEDLMTYDEEVLYYADLEKVLVGELTFKIRDGFYGKACTYRAVINNRYFEGEVNDI